MLRLLGSNNQLVEFNVAWTLTALLLPLPESRVVELGAETSYQLLLQQLAQKSQTFSLKLFLPQSVPYDRRWAAVCFNFDESPIDLYPLEATISSQRAYTRLRSCWRRTR